MPEPTQFDIRHHGAVWTLTRDGKREADYSHADRAIHEAVGRARELQESGTPAAVYLHPQDGATIQVDLDPAPENPQLRELTRS